MFIIYRREMSTVEPARVGIDIGSRTFLLVVKLLIQVVACGVSMELQTYVRNILLREPRRSEPVEAPERLQLGSLRRTHESLNVHDRINGPTYLHFALIHLPFLELWSYRAVQPRRACGSLFCYRHCIVVLATARNARTTWTPSALFERRYTGIQMCAIREQLPCVDQSQTPIFQVRASEAYLGHRAV